MCSRVQLLCVQVLAKKGCVSAGMGWAMTGAEGSRSWTSEHQSHVSTGGLSPTVKFSARSGRKNARKWTAEFSQSEKMSHTPVNKMSSLIYGAPGRRPGQSYKRAPREGSYQNVSTFVVVHHLAPAEMHLPDRYFW